MEKGKNNMKIIGTILAVLLVVVLGVGFLGGDEETQNNENQKSFVINNDDPEKAPIFELQDYSGEIVSLKDFKGKVVVVNAWASWCPFCVNELPDFETLQNEFPDEIVVVAINRAEPLEFAKSFSDKLGLSESYTFLIDRDDTFYKSIGGFSMPETLFVNKKGEVELHKRGPMKIDEMRAIVESILNSK